MYRIAIHGGAGVIAPGMLSEEKEKEYVNALEQAIKAGENILIHGGSALDAVSASVIVLENCPLFNAGRGAVFNHQGKHEMDASIMNGKNKMAGAVSAVQNIKNPIQLARMVMEQSEHVYLTSHGAMEFAQAHNIEICEDAYFYDTFRYAQWEEAKKENKIQLDHSEKKFGTVGAVALDTMGNLAAATSTGGMTNKKYGRVGDTPIIGAGTWADQLCAISCTGHGEYFIRAVVAYDIACLMEYKNMRLEQACDEVVKNKLVEQGGEGGIIAVDKFGNLSLCFNSEGMYRASAGSEMALQCLIYKG